MEDKHIYKEHNKSLILYHFVCPAKYRRDIFEGGVEETLVDICRGIEERYEIRFEEIGADKDHVHFLVQGIPMDSPTSIIRKIKSITARELFKSHPEIKKKLWNGELRTKGYYINTVGMYGGYETIKNYVKNQGQTKEYKERHKRQIDPRYGMTSLFEGLVF